MKRLLSRIAIAAALCLSFGSAAHAAGAYPIKKPKNIDWHFAGPFGTYDKGALQRGLKVYIEVCSACHSLDRVAFRNLSELGYSEAQVKALASEYEVPAAPNIDGEVLDRTAVPSDYFPSPYANVEEAAAANNGAAPPDLSLIAKARAVERGFPTFIFDIFTQYAESGPDYVYSLLTGYEEEVKEGYEIGDGQHYNPYFIAGPALAMAQPLYEDSVEYDDGTAATISQQSKDVTEFLMWAAEPKLEERKRVGFRVMMFLILMTVLVYLTKRIIFASVKH